MASAAITYQLIIQVEQAITIRIGRLGEFEFPQGRYIYTGSAKRNLEARIARHLRQEKALRWHIDWLLTSPGVSVMEVKRFSQDECVVNQKVAGTIVVPGFGASDCRRHCGSHLKRIADSEIRQRREEMGSKKSK